MRRSVSSLQSIVIAGALSLAALGFSQNTTIIGNLAGSSDDIGTSIDDLGQKAMGFTMGGSDYDLFEVALRIEFSGAVANSILDVSLYSNTGSNQLGTKLMSFDTKIVTTSSSGTATIILAPSGSPFKTFRLRANHSYWLLVRSHGSPSVVWRGSSPSIEPIGVATHLGALWNESVGGLPTFASTLLNTYELRGAFRASTAWYMQDPATGQIGVASFRNAHFTHWRTFPQVVGSAWEVLSFGSYGPGVLGHAFLRNKSTGKLAFWYASSDNFYQFVEIPQTPPSVWQFHGSTFFGGFTEFPVYQNPQSGVVIVGAHNGSQITQWRIFPKVPNPAWEIVAVGDTNSNGFGDIMFHNKTTGQIAVWRTDGFDFTTWHVFPQIPSAAWEIIDIIGYPQSEKGVIFQNKATKEYAVWKFNGAGTAFTSWMPMRPQPDPKFNFKGLGFIEQPF